MEPYGLLERCELCPRRCGVNRLAGEVGYCGAGRMAKVAKAMLHMWEEPCISGKKGSGAVFFSDCSMSCVFCQNFEISQRHNGKEVSVEHLADIYLSLQKKGADNINLVSPTHYMPQAAEAVLLARGRGLHIPVLYNTNGFENTDTLKLLEGIIDIYLPDLKYFSDGYAVRYSNAKGYFGYASSAILEMYRQTGPNIFAGGMLKKGIIIRHLLLPGLLSDSKRIIDWICANLPHDIYVSLMCQYVPMYNAKKYPEINKKVARKSYQRLADYFLSVGLKNGYIQEYDSAKTIYTPDFDLEGV